MNRERHKSTHLKGTRVNYKTTLIPSSVFSSPTLPVSSLLFRGKLSGELKNELISVSWRTAPEMDFETLKEAFEATFDEMARYAEEEGMTFTKEGELVETTKAGHRVLYQFVYFTIVEGEEKSYGSIFGVWYCDINQKSYLLIVTSEEDTLPIFQRYLDSFVCH